MFEGIFSNHYHRLPFGCCHSDTYIGAFETKIQIKPVTIYALINIFGMADNNRSTMSHSRTFHVAQLLMAASHKCTHTLHFNGSFSRSRAHFEILAAHFWHAIHYIASRIFPPDSLGVHTHTYGRRPRLKLVQSRGKRQTTRTDRGGKSAEKKITFIQTLIDMLTETFRLRVASHVKCKFIVYHLYLASIQVAK